MSQPFESEQAMPTNAGDFADDATIEESTTTSADADRTAGFESDDEEEVSPSV